MKSAKRSCGAPGGRALPLILTALAFTSGCRRDMMNEPRAKTFSESDFFKDGTNARPLPLHAVARENVVESEAFSIGLTNGVYVTQLPIELTPELLRRGRERFDIYCAPCHGRTGDGNGMIRQRGFPAPPSYHIDRLRQAPAGHFFDVMTRGYGIMYSSASRLEPADRWAIAAYIRALQLSQSATVDDVPADERARLNSEKR